MGTTGQLSASLEDYLEAIFWAVAAKGAARTRDIARQLRVRASSVTGALQVLAERQYIHYAPYETITLTQAGFDEAARVARRHHILRQCFVELLGIDDATAEEGACLLEHDIPPVIVERLARFHEFVKALPEEQRRSICSFAEQRRQCLACETVADTDAGRTTVADLKIGQQGVILAIKRAGSISRRLADMGLGRGALVEVEGIAPMGDPIRVRIRGYRLALRRREAANVTIVGR